MADSEIAGKASFEDIRYAQLWEDADVLLAGLASKPGATLVSICSAGDNALAMLTLDPARSWWSTFRRRRSNALSSAWRCIACSIMQLSSS